METFLPAILSDLLGRSISYLVQRYREQSSVEDSLQKLHLVLARVRVTVEEAEGRHITNQGMLRQLDMLREAMYGGHYLFDALTYGRHHRDGTPPPDHFSFALSTFNPAKRVCFPAGEGAAAATELRRMIDGLGTMIADMKEFVIFLKGYPRLCRQPYSVYLLLDKFMFGRQREMEHIVSFLLRAEQASSGNGVGVLPVVGLARVGKSTLVEHVCHDERVRSHFSSILRMSGHDLEDENLDAPGDHVLIKHQSDGSRSKSSLVIVELAGDAAPDEARWRRLCSSAFCKGNGSKIVVTSRSEAAVQRLGTEHAVRLKFLHQEAYWYFFKVLAFGSANPADHPKLVAIAMDIAAEEKGSFIGANIAGSLLRANLDARFWSSILHNMREYTQKHRCMFGKHPHDLLQKNRPVYLWRLAESSKVFMSYGCYQAPSSAREDQIPERITLQEVLSGRAAPHGRFEALAWRSQIPPCYSYLMSCSVQTPVVVSRTVSKKKRSRHLVIT